MQPELPSEVIPLFRRYLKAADAMIPVQEPESLENTTSLTLWYPDLHLDNISVDPRSKKITNIIDWQRSAVLPLYFQSDISRTLEHPGLMVDGSDLPELLRDYAAF